MDKYRVEFLPIAKQDMVEIVQYISGELKNPAAASRLAEEMISAADGLAAFPYVHSVYQPIRPLAHEYRRVLVGNFTMFYWVDEADRCVTIARTIYSRRDYQTMLE